MVYEREVVTVVAAVEMSGASKLLILMDCQSVVKAIDKAIGTAPQPEELSERSGKLPGIKRWP